MTEKQIQRTCDIDTETSIATERDMTTEELQKFEADLAVLNAQLEARTTSE
jgi:hypothetical protein